MNSPSRKRKIWDWKSCKKSAPLPSPVGGTLLIEAGRQIAGHIHAGSGHVHLTESDHSLGDDLLDDLGEEVVKKGGRVVVVPSGQMPTKTGAAAINRF